MTLMSRLRSFAGALLWRRRLEREMDEERQFHLDARADALVTAGMTRDDAGRRARAEFGDPLRWKEQGREARGLGWLQDIGGDALYALRQMRRAPAFAVVIVATLALGIGANTAIFTVANSALLRALPVVDPQRLVTVTSDTAARMGFDSGLGWNYAMWTRFQPRAEAFGGAFAWTAARLDVTRSSERELLDALLASGDFFATLGVPALLGRTFTAQDDVRGGGPDGPVAVISYRLWQRRFGGAHGVVGTSLVVGGVPFTIAGVTPPNFFGIEVGRPFDIALPLGTEPLIRGRRSALDAPRNLFLSVMLRLGASQSVDEATATLRGMQADILGISPAQVPHVDPPFLREPFTLASAATGVSGAARLRQRFGRPLLTILIVAVLVLLVACANLANLLLARAAARRHELSIRRALGASHWRLLRQWLVESLLLAGLGAAAGLLIAAWGSRGLVGLLSTPDALVSMDLSLDWRVLTFTAILTVATMVLLGTAPAMRTARVDAVDALKMQGSDGGRRGGLSGALVVAQVALSLVLVVAAALFTRTFGYLAGVPLGFDQNRVLVVNVDTGRAAADAARRLAFYQTLVDAVAAVPGVTHASGSQWTPVSGGGAGLLRDANGRMVDVARVVTNFITPGWFGTYGIAIREGRDFDARDTAKGLPVAVVNQTLARKLTSEPSALGATVVGMGGKPRTIVAIVADAMFAGSLRDPVPPMMFVPLAQSEGLGPPGSAGINISVRSAAGPPMRLARGVGAALTATEPALTYSVRALTQFVTTSMIQERLVATLSGLFGGLALLLASVGLYGVTAYAVGQRRTEIAIRLALGAPPVRVVRLVFARVSLLIAAGVLIGGIASVWLSPFVAPLLYRLEPRDPVAFASAVLTLGAVGALAGWLPAFRASRIDPARVLRDS